METYSDIKLIELSVGRELLTGINIVKIGVVGNNTHIGVGFEF